MPKRSRVSIGNDPVHREALRILRANLLVTLADLENPIVIVTSALAGEGKTSTCTGLARSLSSTGLRVVLVDLDLRRPNAHRWVGGHNESGVVDVLLQRRPLDECLQFIEPAADQEDGGSGLYFLASGEGASNPTELLGTTRTARLLESLSAQADIVLLDTPPILPVADTLVVGRMAAGALLVVEARHTPITSVLQAKDALTRNQTRLLGVALNKLQARDLASSALYGY